MSPEKIRQLDLVSRRNVTSRFMGNYLTAFRGSGLSFYEARKYVYGDSIRHIDWNMTARMDTPYVRVTEEERQRNIILVLDVSPSMRIGFQEKTKLGYAAEVCATLAFSATKTGDRIGLVLFANDCKLYLPPKTGSPQLYRVYKELLSAEESGFSAQVSDPRSAIRRIETSLKEPAVLFFVSDFIDYDVTEDIRFLRRMHDVSFFRISDPFEMQISRLKLLTRDAETGVVRGSVSDEDILEEETRAASLEAECIRLRILMEHFSTNMPVREALSRFFQKKSEMLL